MEFHSTKANEPLLQAVEIIRGMNESGKRKVPDDSPVDFISKRWKNTYMRMTVQSIVIIMKWLSANSNKLDGVSLEKGKLSISRLEKDIPEEAKKFSASLYKMLPRIKLTDLLMDVLNPHFPDGTSYSSIFLWVFLNAKKVLKALYKIGNICYIIGVVWGNHNRITAKFIGFIW